MLTLSSPAARFDRRLPPRPSTTAGSLLLSCSWVCGSLSPCGTGSTTDPGSQWLQAPLLLFRLVKSSRTLHIQSPAGPRAQPPGCGPITKGPALPLWGHIPGQFAASQSFNGPKPSNVRPSIIVTARPRMTGIEPSSDRHGSCSLHRYTTLKIAGAAHKLSVNESRF